MSARPLARDKNTTFSTDGIWKMPHVQLIPATHPFNLPDQFWHPPDIPKFEAGFGL